MAKNSTRGAFDKAINKALKEAQQEIDQKIEEKLNGLTVDAGDVTINPNIVIDPKFKGNIKSEIQKQVPDKVSVDTELEIKAYVPKKIEEVDLSKMVKMDSDDLKKNIQKYFKSAENGSEKASMNFIAAIKVAMKKGLDVSNIVPGNSLAAYEGYYSDFVKKVNEELSKVDFSPLSSQVVNKSYSTTISAFKSIIKESQKVGSVEKFLSGISNGSIKATDRMNDLLEIVKVLSNGKYNFSGLEAGTKHVDGVVSDKYTIIGRALEDNKGNDTGVEDKVNSLIPKLQEAKREGVQLGSILGTIKDEANGVIYEIQETQKGKIINEDNLDWLQATDEQLIKFKKDLETLNKLGIYIDIGAGMENILYDKNKGFSFLDLALPKDGELPKDYQVNTVSAITEELDDIFSFAEDETRQKVLSFNNRLTNITSEAATAPKTLETKTSEVVNTVTESVSKVDEQIKQVESSVVKYNNAISNMQTPGFHVGNLESDKNYISDSLQDNTKTLSRMGSGSFWMTDIDEALTYLEEKTQAGEDVKLYITDLGKVLGDMVDIKSVGEYEEYTDFLGSFNTFVMNLASEGDTLSEAGDITSVDDLYKNFYLYFQDLGINRVKLDGVIEDAVSYVKSNIDSTQKVDDLSSYIQSKYGHKKGVSTKDVADLDNYGVGSVVFHKEDLGDIYSADSKDQLNTEVIESMFKQALLEKAQNDENTLEEFEDLLSRYEQSSVLKDIFGTDGLENILDSMRETHMEAIGIFDKISSGYDEIENKSGQQNLDITNEEISSLNAKEKELVNTEEEVKTEAASSFNQMSNGARNTAGNLHLITDELGEIKTFYRGLRDSMGQGLISDRFNGSTFWTDNFDLAKEYSEYSKIESANLGMVNPLEIEGNGANWDEIEYLGTWADKESVTINVAKKVLMDTIDQFRKELHDGFDFSDIITPEGFKEIDDFFQREIQAFEDNGSDFANSIRKQYQNVKDAYEAYVSISEDESNVYGMHNTKEFVSLAQNSDKNYDGVIFKNIVDSWSGDVTDLTNVVVQFDESKINFLETISARENLSLQDFQIISKQYALSISEIQDTLDKNRANGLIENIEKLETKIPMLKEFRDSLINSESSSDTVSLIKNMSNSMNELYQNNGIDALTSDLKNFDVELYKSIVSTETLNGLVEQWELGFFDFNDSTLFTNEEAQERVGFGRLANTPKEEISFEDENVDEIEETINAFKQEEQIVEDVVKSEEDILSSLSSSINEVIRKVDEKSESFKAEQKIVDTVIQAENGKLDTLSTTLNDLKGKVEDVSKAFSDIDLTLPELNNSSQITKFINSLSRIDADKIDIKLITLWSALDDFINGVNKLDLKDSNILSSINGLLVKSKELENLASILKSTKSKIEATQKATKSDAEKEREDNVKNYIKLINERNKLETKNLTKNKYGANSARDDELSKITEEIAELEKLNFTEEENERITRATATSAAALEDALNAVNVASEKQSTKDSSNLEKYKANIDSAATSLKVLESKRNYVSSFSDQISELKQQLNTLKENSTDIDVVSDSELNQLNIIISKIKELSKEASIAENRVANENSIQKQLGKINDVITSNTKMSFKLTDVYKRYLELQDAFKNFDTSRPQSELNELITTALKLDAEFKELDDTVKGTGFFGNFVHRLSDMNAKFFAQYFSFQDMVRYARTAITTIIDLDTQLVDLRKTTKMNSDELNEFYSASSNVAKQLGVTTSEIISQAAAWSRLGYNTKEESTEMAKLSSQFASISPGMDTDSATDTLVSTMQAYKIGVDDVQRTVMDNINAIGNSMATTNEEIGEMLQRSSAAMKAANNSLEETIALESAAVEITRNAETTGTAFRTISMRIRGYDEETEELSDDLKSISGDIYDLTKVNGKGISIFTDESRTEYKSTYEILREIAGIWDELTDKQQADLLEKLGGKRGAQSLAGILDDFSSVEEAMATMENAAGSADREMDIIRDSLEFKINELKQTWVGMLTEVADRGGIGNIVDGLTNISEALGWIVSNLGLVKTSLIGVFGVIGSQKLGFFNDKNGFGFNIKDIFSNRNAEILEQDSSKAFLSGVQELSNTASPEQIQGLADSIGNVDKSLVNFTVKARQAGISATDLGTKFAAQTSITGKFQEAMSNLGTVGIKVLKSLGDAAISMGIAAIISVAIQAIDNLIHSYEDLAEAAQEISSEYIKNKKTLSDYSSEIQDLRDVLANQESTTQEVADATSRLYEIQNDLIGTYGEYATGLDLVNGKLSTQLHILEDIDKQNAQQAINEINDNRSAKSGAINVGVKSSINMTLPGMMLNTINSLNTAYDDLVNKEKGAGETFKDVFSGGFFGIDFGENVAGTSVDQIIEKYENFDATIKNIDNDKIKDIAEGLDGISFRNGSMEIKGDVKTVSDSITSLQARLQEFNKNGQFDGIIKDLQKVNKNATELYESSADSYNTIIMSDIYNSPKLLEYYRQIQSAYEDIQTARTSGSYDDIQEAEKTYQQFIDKLENTEGLDQKYINFFENLYPELQNLTSEWELEVKIIPNMDELTEDYIKSHTQEEIISDYAKYLTGDDTNKDIFKNISSDANNAGFTSITSYISAVKSSNKSFSDNMLHAKELLGDNWKDEMEGEFTEQELEIVAAIKPKYTEESKAEYEEAINKLPDGIQKIWQDKLDLGEVKLEADDYSLDELKQEIEDYLNPVELDVKAKSVDVAEDLDSLEDDWGSLSTAYESTVTNGEVVSASDLQSVNDDFGGVKDESGTYTKMATALERYNDALIENPGDTDAAQQGADEVATAYIDLNNVLDDLTEENADYYEQILKDNKVENAHEVVQSRLNKTYKATRQNLENVSKAFSNVTEAGNSYLDVIESADKSSSEYIEATDGLVESVSELLGLYDQDTGELISPANIDGDFVRDNIDTIIDAIGGVDGAVDELYTSLAMLDAEQIYIDAGIDTSEYQADLSEIESLVNYASSLDIENDAYINDSQFMSTLNKLMSSSSETAAAVSAALSDIGIKVSYKTTPKKIKVATDGSHATSIYGGENAGKTVSWDWVEVDDFEVVAQKTGSTGTTGTGVKNYGGGSSSSSSDGGGSDSGSDSEDSSETFDWVEVQIGRIEEQLDRLDEAVDNVYSNWESRNKNLRKEIELTNTEISKQVKAAQIYEDKANAVDWGSTDSATKSKYIEKIKNGEIIDVNSIEEITNNDDLTEAISEYQDYWQKHIDALDTATTLGITVKEYYKQLFENIESEYDDLITNIEKKNDIIEERITRTEEHGYFVDQNYYDEELKLEKQNEEKLLAERGKLIDALNEAVNVGKIEYGSEAWNEMYQSIMDVNKALEESYTNTVKLNNAIRQLKWDAFDWIEDRISDISAEADFLIGLLQGELNYEDNGQFNNRGFAQAGLVGAKYDETLAKAQRYKKEILEINEALANDPNDKNLIERKEELVQAYRDAISAAEDEKQAMKSLVEEAFNKHLESLQEIIDKYKEAMQSAKDLYSTQKDIANQTKNISDLEKQLAALEGDDSEESRKRRQELTNQLDAAQQQLEETEWDKYISETSDMLDTLYSDYEDYLNGKLDYVTVLMNDMINYLNSNGANIQAGLSEIKSEYGLTTLYFEDFGSTADSILSTFNNGDFANKLTNISSIIENFKDTMTKVTETSTNGVIKAIEAKSVDVKINGDGTVSVTTDGVTSTSGKSSSSSSKTSGSGSGSGSSKSSGSTGKNGWEKSDGKWFYYQNGVMQTDKWILDKDGWYYYVDPAGVMKTDEFVEGYWVGDDGKMRPDYFSWHQSSNGKWWYGTDDGSKYATDKVYIDGKWYTFDKDGWWKGYAKGTRKVHNSQLAWTQEDKSELIFRSSDGAMLTPLGRGDMVFTNEMSQRLWDFAKGNIGASLDFNPKVGGITPQSITSNNSISINLPNVKNYDEFKQAMKNDSELEQFLQEVTIGQVMGNNKLRKNRL